MIHSETDEIFISLDKLNSDCVERIKEAIDNKVSIQEYLENFTKPLTTKYEAKKPKRLIANFDSDSEDIKQERKKKLIVNEMSSSSQDFENKPKKRQTKKKLEAKVDKSKTKKNLTKSKLIVNGDSSSDI